MLDFPMSRPQKQDQQPPKVISEVSPPFEVCPHRLINRRPRKDAGCPDRSFVQGIEQKRPQNRSQPMMYRDIEPFFPPRKYCRGELALHQLPQDKLQLATS